MAELEAATKRQAMSQSRPWVACWALVLLWLAAQLLWFRPPELAVDWNGWRQADTQSMALGFVRSGGDVFHPRIRWGGDGPGFVESELALYPFLIALVAKAVGPEAAIGQVLSALFMAASALVLARLLRLRFGATAALAGIATFLSPNAVAHLATAVQPEALSVLASVLALTAFLRWASAPDQRRWLAAYALLACLACLVKPTAVQILVAPMLVAAVDRGLRRHLGPLALALCGVAAIGVTYLLHARSLYVEYGNTFGLLSGGDRKTPRLEHLLHPTLFLRTLGVFLEWGLGLAGAAALIILAVHRRLDLWLCAFGAAAGVWALVSLRYSANEYLGSHYMVLGALMAAWAVALCVERAATWSERRRRVIHAVLGVALVAQLALSYSRRHRSAHRDSTSIPEYQMGLALARIAAPDTLVVVRTPGTEYVSYWKTPNNYQDPTVMYLSWTRGWILPGDAARPDLLRTALARGARYFVDPQPASRARAIEAWLHPNGRRVVAGANGEIWALQNGPGYDGAPIPDHP